MTAVHTSIADHIATVTLDRPPVNALDLPTILEIRDAFLGLENNRDVRAAMRLTEDHLDHVERNLRLDPRSPDLAQILSAE